MQKNSAFLRVKRFIDRPVGVSFFGPPCNFCRLRRPHSDRSGNWRLLSCRYWDSGWRQGSVRLPILSCRDCICCIVDAVEWTMEVSEQLLSRCVLCLSWPLRHSHWQKLFQPAQGEMQLWRWNIRHRSSSAMTERPCELDQWFQTRSRDVGQIVS